MFNAINAVATISEATLAIAAEEQVKDLPLEMYALVGGGEGGMVNL